MKASPPRAKIHPDGSSRTSARSLEKNPLMCGRHLHYHPVLEVGTEQPPVASLDRLPGVRLQRAAGDEGVAAACEDPPRRVLADFRQVLGKEPVDVRKTRLRRDIVQHDHGILVLEDLLVGRADRKSTRLNSSHLVISY